MYASKVPHVHPFSMYAQFSENLTLKLTYVCLSGVRNVSISENFAHVLNGWSPRAYTYVDNIFDTLMAEVITIFMYSHNTQLRF